MNNSLDGSNLVNLSGDLSELNQLDTKETLALSFPFDHIYACHSEDSVRRQEQIAKEVEISLQPDIKVAAGDSTDDLNKKLIAAELQNTRLRHLLVHHLDLITLQNDLLTKTEKQNTELKLENDCLKSKVTRMDRRITVSQRHNINPAPVINAPPPNVPPPIVPPPIVSSPVKTESSDGQVVFNSLTDFKVPESRPNPYTFNSDIPKTKPSILDPFNLNRPSETDVTTYLPGNIGVPSILEKSSLQSDNLSTMIENKRSYTKKDAKPEPRSEPLYTVTSNSGNTVIQKIQRTRRRTSGGLGSLSRLPKTPVVKPEPSDNVNMFEDDKAFERNFSVNKKSKMINTYGKSKSSTIAKKTPHYTGSLSDRLQLIDTTPTGEDPYQLGEADMREQSPIPKLMLQKTNHGRLKICSDLMGESKMPSRRIYDAPVTETSTKMPNKITLEKRYNLPTIVPYSVRTVTHTSTHTSNKSTDACTHISTYTHVPKTALTPKQQTPTPKQTSTFTPKHTSTLTSTNACTHMSTYTHTTRNTTARTATAAHKGAKKATKSLQGGSRKSTHAGSNKASQKASSKTPLPTPHTSSMMATLTPLHMVPLMTTHTATHTATHGGLHAALITTPALVTPSSATHGRMHAALITTPRPVTPSSATHGTLHAALLTTSRPVTPSSSTHGSLHAALITTSRPVTPSSATHGGLHAALITTPRSVTPTSVTHGNLHAALITTPRSVTPSSATHGSLHAALITPPTTATPGSAPHGCLHAALLTTSRTVTPTSTTHGSLHAALITTPRPVTPSSATHGSLHAALITTTRPVTPSSTTHGSLHAALITAPRPVTPSLASHGDLHAALISTSALLTPSSATHSSLLTALTSTPVLPPVTQSSATHGSLHTAITPTPMSVTPSSATHGSLHATLTPALMPVSPNSTAHGSLHATHTATPMPESPSAAIHGSLHTTLTSTAVPEIPSSATHGSLHAAFTTTSMPVTQSLFAHTNTEIKKEAPDSPTLPPNLVIQQPQIGCVKKEEPPEYNEDSDDLEWTFTYTTGNETSLSDFSYGENSNVTVLPAHEVAKFRQLIESQVAAAGPAGAAAALGDHETLEMSVPSPNIETDKIKKKGSRTSSLAVSGEETSDNKRGMGSKRGRKRALSTAGLTKNAKQNLSKPVGPKPKMVKGKAACRGKKSPLPGMMSKKPYHTLVGDPDLSWYHGLDPDVKMEDIDQGDCKASTVEVPRWREKPYTCVYSLEGTENLDDKVFEKRHQKLEAEERRQLRWHMRRIREQRHVERLRMRQRDPWYNHSRYQPSVYTIWPQPQRDLRTIEITDTVPVKAFGEDLPDIPPADFMLPWVRTSKPLKRSKRSKTLH